MNEITNKLGPYVSKLMTTIIDKGGDEFVIDLAWNELNRVNQNIMEFLRKNQRDESEKQEQTEKQLLQEDK